MILRDNPVLTRELLVNLRSNRSFVLLAVYVGFLGLLVWLAWGDTSGNTGRTAALNADASIRLFNLFFVGQFLLVTLMAPTFAAGAITGEKERKTYEMLLASPLKPGVILVGKLLSSVSFLVLLIIATLPLTTLCFLRGGLLLSDIVRAYVVLTISAVIFGMLSLICSSFFTRTSSALVVSYLTILPLALLLLASVQLTGPETREFLSIVVLPPWTLVGLALVGSAVRERLLHPPDLGSEGKEVVDEEEEQRHAIGVVIDREAFPDRLFAPAKRVDLMPDGINPVLDKELRSEIFSQGTLMLRIVIQVSMLMSIILMFLWLFQFPERAGYYVSYVLTFNLLVGPVFSAGAITQERERKTVGLLLTTLLTPWRILSAKLLAALRVSTVLTLLLTEQIVLGYLLNSEFHPRWWTFFLFMMIIVHSCMMTTSIGLLCSSLVKRTTTAMILTYLFLMLIYVAPIGAFNFIQAFFPEVSEANLRWLLTLSPYAAAVDIPLGITPLGASSGPTTPIPFGAEESFGWLGPGYGDPLPGIGLPVWLVHLILFPLVTPLIWAAAYLAFRYNWWVAARNI